MAEARRLFHGFSPLSSWGPTSFGLTSCFHPWIGLLDLGILASQSGTSAVVRVIHVVVVQAPDRVHVIRVVVVAGVRGAQPPIHCTMQVGPI